VSNENILILDKNKIISTAWFIGLVGIAAIVPLFHQQMITGPIVNTTLFAATIFLGTRMGIFVGLIPSIIALSVRMLPAPLAPMVPYIMLGNAILILTFGFLKDKNYWLAVIIASFLKFIFLYLTSSVVIGLLMKKELADSVTIMMSYPQFFTALGGGVLFWIFSGKSLGKR